MVSRTHPTIAERISQLQSGFVCEECVMNRGRLPGLVSGGGSSVVGKRETRLYEPEERLHSFRGGVKTGAFL
ncbi:hypothetical protein IEQ34_023347 [Dendrobium chrysotoxum]|uniref:Uncharacterized protein n=1 Tax=Dendrobium chrysotoxum TaxID=161865 RepID=A0AAV7FWV3_DENCH|nr:hypothetical protein IEQ34_023347 [Dendrobium chrysotoxum]